MNKDMGKIFVTGTDTGVGKTWVCANLLAGAKFAGDTLNYWKPIQTGPKAEDRTFVEKSTGIKCSTLEAFSFCAPLSPDQSAAKESSTFANLKELNSKLAEIPDNTILEGAGGVFVPFNPEFENWVDFLDQNQMPVLLVARSTLGTINHTCLTLQTLWARGIDVIGLVLNGEKNLDNRKSIQRFAQKKWNKTLPIYSLERQKFFAADNKLWDWLKEENSIFYKTKKKNQDIVEQLDKKHCWHPLTQHRTWDQPLKIIAAKKEMLLTEDHGWVIDGVGSWWSNLSGHGREDIGNTVHRQQSQLDHVLYAETIHKPAAELSKRIVDFVGSSTLQRVFFSDNGSSAIEVALKMAVQYWKQTGKPARTKFMALNKSFHGDTVGAMSLGAGSGFHDGFKELMFDAFFVNPVTSHKSSFKQNSAEALESLSTLLDKHGDQIAAFVVEPLVQGAGGMLFHNIEWLREVCKRVRSKGILVVFDEVFTGMGRLGVPTASTLLGFVPDFMCLAKGLTSSAAAMALTLTSENIFEAFLSKKGELAFLHGHTFTAHPVACAAASQTLDIYAKENLVKRARELEESFQEWGSYAEKKWRIENFRALGSVLAFEMPKTGANNYFDGNKSAWMRIALETGIFLRPLGNTVYCCPQLCVDSKKLMEKLSMFLEKVKNTLN